MIPGLCSALYKGQSIGSFSATATPTAVDTIGNGLLNSSNFTAAPSGGAAPYTYSWFYVMGDPNISIISPTTASAHARCFVGPGDSTQGFIACNVTDSAARVVTTNQVTVTFESNS